MKKIIFIIMLFVLWIPKIMDELNLFSPAPLNGVAAPTEKPIFDLKKWWNSGFQNNYSEYIDETFGLRNILIRLYNQFDYSLFNKPHGDIVIGKNGYLFQESYIDEITGGGYILEETMKKNIENIHFVESYLDKINICLITILAPGKTDYYKEYLPDYYFNKISDIRNYASILKYGKEKNIRLIDFNNWFMQIKDTSRYPLFPKQGIHWNFYGMALCADSIVKYVAAEKETKLPQISWTLEFPDTLRETDKDLSDLMNIYRHLPFDKMPYPRFNIQSDSSMSHLRLLVIGDSFYWTIFNERVFGRVFDNETFYYYCSTIHPNDRAASNNPYDLNILKEVEKYDVILLLQSSGNYGNPGVNFIQLFTSELNRRNEYRAMAKNIFEENIKLLNYAKEISRSENISIDSAETILTDSIADSKLAYLSNCKIQMRKNPEWMQHLYEKSDQQKKSIEEIMQTDAEWMFENSNK